MQLVQEWLNRPRDVELRFRASLHHQLALCLVFVLYKGTQYNSVTEKSRLMLYGEITVVYWENFMGKL